jgi:hypothetical protein
MPRPLHSPEDRQHALDVYRDHGPAEAGRQTGISVKTIASWARRAGVQMSAEHAVDHLQRATEINVSTLRERRARAAITLHVDGFERLFAKLWEPTLLRHWGTESTYDNGRLVGTRTVLMEHEIPCPTFADQKTILSAAAIALDRSMKLTGDETGPVGANILVQIQQRLAGGLDAETRVQVAALLDTIEAPTEPAA